MGEIEPVVTHFGRVSDLIVMSRFQANDLVAERCFDAAVFGSGRPTLVVSATLPWDMLDHVMIAWNGSLEASHAVFGAMPLLRAAGRVSIFSVQEVKTDQASGAELVEALSWYGIPACHVGGPETQGSTGAALLTMAGRNEATLIDLTQLTLGVDSDSEIVAFDFDERDPGMPKMLRLAVTGAKRNHRHVGICGEAPTNYPEIARFLADLGIDSISVNAASLFRTMSVVHEAEQNSRTTPAAAE